MIVSTKLIPPTLKASLIHRPNLITKIDAGRETCLILVSAPPGFGKTTLITSWLKQTAVKLAEPGGFVRLFVDEGPAAARLLHNSTINTPYLRKLMAACRSQRPPKQDSAHPLTDRELMTLHLLASERTIPEVAAELVVSITTVRTYCKRIYGKLDAHSRTEAIYPAQERNIL